MYKMFGKSAYLSDAEFLNLVCLYLPGYNLPIWLVQNLQFTHQFQSRIISHIIRGKKRLEKGAACTEIVSLEIASCIF